MGMSIRRYFPARGTAGFDRNLVSGYNRVPLPPPSTSVLILVLPSAPIQGMKNGKRREFLNERKFRTANRMNKHRDPPLWYTFQSGLKPSAGECRTSPSDSFPQLASRAKSVST